MLCFFGCFSTPLCVTRVCPWQLFAPVDRISSNVMMETVFWAADSVTASETAPTDQTKSTAKTVSALCVSSLKKKLGFEFPSFPPQAVLRFRSCLSVCVCCQCRFCGHVNGLNVFSICITTHIRLCLGT